MIKKIFFVGIKGVGVAPLAIIAQQAGFLVEGADLAEVFITDKYLNIEKIKIHNQFDPNILMEFFANLEKDECLVITTGAHGGFDNPISLWAKNNGYNVLSLGEALGKFMSGEIFERNDIKGVSVAGSHGKTTITSMLATALEFLKKDISYSVGTGELFPLGAPGKYGKGELFVVEADEYASEPVYDRTPKLLYQHPYYAVINNIDFDHPDIFPTIEDIEKVFIKFIENIHKDGVLFINGDDERLMSLKEKAHDIRVIAYGKKAHNDYIVEDIRVEGFSSHFSVIKNEEAFGELQLLVPGEHNASNSLAVIALLVELGFDYEEIRAALITFNGSKRRSEVIGITRGGAIIIDDYGHHPLEISTTLSSIKKAYPRRKIVCVFQPHTYSRTKALLSDFANSFTACDELILMPVFKSQRDTEKDTISYDEYVNAYTRVRDHVTFLKEESDVIEYLKKNYDQNESVIVTMGAGDLYRMGSELIK